MKHLVLAVFTIILLVACKNYSQDNLVNNSIVLAGKLDNYNGGNLTLTFNNSPIKITPSESGEFHFLSELNYPMYANINIGGFDLPIFCVQGDSVFFSIDSNAKNKFESALFSGDHAKENNFLVKATMFRSKRREAVDFVKRALTPIEQIDSIIVAKMDVYSEFLKKNMKSDFHPLLKEFEIWRKDYEELFHRNTYHLAKQLTLDKKIRERIDPTGRIKGEIDVDFPKDYFNIINRIDISNRNLFLLNESVYTGAVYTTIRRLLSDGEPGPGSTEELINKYSIYFDEAKKIIGDPVIMQRLYFHRLDFLLNIGSVKVAKHFSPLLTEPMKKQIILKGIEKIEGLESINFPDFIAETPNGEKFTNKDLMGTYTYIDFWATWCIPCIKEIPHLQKLEIEYHGKNIRFLSISTDREADKEKWEKMLIDKGMTGLQVRIEDSSYKALSKKMMISAIPRFVLLDPNGVVIKSSAPRPSSSSIRPMLNKLKDL